MVSGVPYPSWGCYTSAAASCKCEARQEYDEPDYGRGYGGDYSHDRGGGDDGDDDDDYWDRKYRESSDGEGPDRSFDEDGYPGDDDEYRRYRDRYGDDDYHDDYHERYRDDERYRRRYGGGDDDDDYTRDRHDEHDEHGYEHDYEHDDRERDEHRGRYDDDDDDYGHRDHSGEGDYAGEAAGAAQTDYNAEYYHGETKADDEDAKQPQTAEQFMLGAHLLVQPITAIDIAVTSVYLPAVSREETAEGSAWYDLHTGVRFLSRAGERVVSIDVHPDHVPAFVRGGAVLPTRERLRRSSQGTHTDPFTLIVAPDASGAASGELFLDAYDGYADNSLTVRFTWSAGVLRCEVASRVGSGELPAASSLVERIRVLGQHSARHVRVTRSTGEVIADVEALHDEKSGVITVRQPKVSVGDTWAVELL